MAFTAQKGHGNRVLEYHARRSGICLFPFNDADPDGWYYPAIDGVTTRTARTSGQVATPYAVLSTPNPETPLRASHPRTIGNPGNEQPFGTQYWVNQKDQTVSISWGTTQYVYMRGFKVFTVDKPRACSIYEGTVVLMTATAVYTCPLADMVFNGDTAANNALLIQQLTYPETFSDWGSYVSPLGSKLVLITTKEVHTITIDNQGVVSLATTNQPPVPDKNDVARMSVTDTFTEVIDTNYPSGFRSNYSGGRSGSTTVDIDYTYQYGVKWEGETPQPVDMHVVRHFEFAYQQNTDAFVHWIATGRVDHHQGGCTADVQYSESSTNTVIGLGDPLVFYSKTKNHQRTWSQDSAFGGGADDVNMSMDFSVSETDTTTDVRDIIRTADGKVLVSMLYTGDESADNQTASAAFSWFPSNPENIADVAPNVRYFPDNISLDGTGLSANVVGTPIFGNLTPSNFAGMTFNGPQTKDFSVSFDGQQEFFHTKPENRPLQSVNRADLAADQIKIVNSPFEVQSVYQDNAQVRWNEDFFEPGFLREVSRRFATSVIAGTFASGADFDGTASYAVYNGVAIVATDPGGVEGGWPRTLFTSDNSDLFSLLDIPPDAGATWLGVI